MLKESNLQTMKTIINASTKRIIRSYDEQLAVMLKEDISKFRKENQTNLIDFNTRRYDLELQLLLQADLNNFKNTNSKFAHVG